MVTGALPPEYPHIENDFRIVNSPAGPTTRPGENHFRSPLIKLLAKRGV